MKRIRKPFEYYWKKYRLDPVGGVVFKSEARFWFTQGRKQGEADIQRAIDKNKAKKAAT